MMTFLNCAERYLAWKGKRKEGSTAGLSHCTAWNQTALHSEQGQGGAEKGPKAPAVIKIIILL